MIHTIRFTEEQRREVESIWSFYGEWGGAMFGQPIMRADFAELRFKEYSPHECKMIQDVLHRIIAKRRHKKKTLQP